MNSVRRKRLVTLALDYLSQWWGEAEELFRREYNSEHHAEPSRIELEVPTRTGGSRFMMSPTDAEMAVITGEGRKGNWRTKELVFLAVTFFQENLEHIVDGNEYCYDGQSEALVDTHLSFNGVNFKIPTAEELETLLDWDELEKIVKLLPAVPCKAIGWDVYDLVDSEDDRQPEYEMIDTVYFAANCDRDYVKKSLVGHDGHNDSIVCVC